MKDTLVALITTYVNARVSSDPVLIDFAGGRLNQFLMAVDIVEAKTEEPEITEEPDNA